VTSYGFSTSGKAISQAYKNSLTKKTKGFFFVGLSFLFWIFLSPGCISKTPVIREPRTPEVVQPPIQTKGLSRLGYAIQVGAFAQVENAVRLVRSLKRQEVEAYYFVYKTGIYKVRFGDFPSDKLAREKAEDLKARGIIEEFYIVNPGDYAVSHLQRFGAPYLRDELIGTAEKFIGVPYLWGGTSPGEGFDCSGLTMVVYQLNGLSLPRSSKAQFDSGLSVEKEHLSRGDLVFFNTKGTGKVSHVGIYIGEGKFIHAPGWGKKIGVESLSKGYYRKRFAGARTYFTSRL
jgi:cell wall-associated NlpC family hydrolase